MPEVKAMKEYRKHYWPLALWCVLLVPVMMLGFYGAQWLGMDELASIAVMMLSMNLALVGLFVLIRRGEYVYWINGGPDFEQAKASTSAVRREYARKHLLCVLKGTAASALLMAVMYARRASEVAMVVLPTVCIVVSAFSTMKIKWTEERKEEQ